ncbi:MAG: hypothetical protein Q9160_004764 [Pyrenula sp. 1 TL-2023]
MPIGCIIRRLRIYEEEKARAIARGAPSNPTCFLTQLPPEIKILIIDFVQPRDLKSIRLAHSSFRAHATKLLFKDIDLSSLPSVFLHHEPPRRYDNSNEALEYIQSLIKSITFHTNVFQQPIMEFDGFRAQLKKNMHAFKAIRPDLSRVDLSRAEEKELHTRYERIYYDVWGFSDHLVTKLLHLKSLESFEIRRDKTEDFPREMNQSCLRQAMSHGSFFSGTGIQPDGWMNSLNIGQLLIGLLTGTNISRLILNNMDWGFLNYVPCANSLKDLAPRLRHLSISLAGGTPERIAFSCQRQLLSEVLSNCNNLHSLDLEFDSVVSGYNKNDPQKFVLFSQIFSKWHNWTVACPPFPSLTKLRFHGFYISRQQLCHLLSVHASKLKHLELSDVDLPFALQETLGLEAGLCAPDTDFSGVDAWYNVFKEMRTLHNLDSLTLRGRLTNQWDEGWLISPSDDTTSLMRRVIDYVLRKRETLPLPDREICSPGTCYAELSAVKQIENQSFKYDTKRLWYPGLRETVRT